MKHKTIFCICGHTASGKDSITDGVSFACGIPKIVSFSTRPKREGESNDKHIFISEEAYEVFKRKNEFAACTQIGDYHYFTTKSQIEALFENHDAVLYVIDPDGIETLRQAMKDVRIVVIYINASREECRTRAIKRGDNYYDHHNRVLSEYNRFTKMLRAADFDYAVKNDNLSKSVSVVADIVETEMKEK